MRVTSGDLALIGILVVFVVPTFAALWRFATRVRDNTTAVEHLAAVVEGSANAIGLNNRVRALEDWRTGVEAVHAAEAEHARAGP